jgi:hypothetical protein
MDANGEQSEDFSQNGSEEVEYDALVEAYYLGLQHGSVLKRLSFTYTPDGTPVLANGKGVEYIVGEGFLINVLTGEEVDPLEHVAVGLRHQEEGERVYN